MLNTCTCTSYMYLMFPHDRQNLVIKKSLKFPRDVNIVMNLTTIPNNIFLPTKQSESVDQSLDD